MIHAWGKDTTTPKEKISASAIAGGIAGTCGGLLSKSAQEILLLLPFLYLDISALTRSFLA